MGRISKIQIDKDQVAAGETGAALIEFALVVPIMIAFMAIVADIGIVLREVQATSYAAREGARIAAVATVDSPGKPCSEYRELAEKETIKILNSGGLSAESWAVAASVADAPLSADLRGPGELKLMTVSVERRGSPLFEISRKLFSQISVQSTFSLYNGGLC